MSVDLEHLLAPPEPAPRLVRTPIKHPPGFTPGHEWNGREGTITTGPLEERPTTWDAHLRDAFPDEDIADLEVVEPAEVRGWDAAVGDGRVERMRYYKLRVRRRSAHAVDLPHLLAEARRAGKRKPRRLEGEAESVTVVAWADPQTGKVASRGGTPELVQRSQETLERLDGYLRRVKPDAALLLDAGDAVEGFENTGSQAFTNDLSLPEQIDVAATIQFSAVDLLARSVAAVRVLGVGSNHCRWRKGKDALGRPGDDWGIYMLKQLRRSLAINPAAYGHVDVSWPGEWEETAALEAAGYVVGLAHGHQSPRPEGIPSWWAKQTHGGQPTGHADILVTGHFHHLRVQPTGRNPWRDRSRWWVQAPTMDNGSDWYRATSGDDSDPGLLVFTLRAGTDGFPFHGLEVL